MGVFGLCLCASFPLHSVCMIGSVCVCVCLCVCVMCVIAVAFFRQQLIVFVWFCDVSGQGWNLTEPDM